MKKEQTEQRLTSTDALRLDTPDSISSHRKLQYSECVCPVASKQVSWATDHSDCCLHCSGWYDGPKAAGVHSKEVHGETHLCREHTKGCIHVLPHSNVCKRENMCIHEGFPWASFEKWLKINYRLQNTLHTTNILACDEIGVTRVRILLSLCSST